MREKLLDLMKNEGLKPSQFAEMLEVNPAGISHLMAGRNKPSFELLQKILRRFPRINPDWLLLDSPQMYREPEATSPVSTNANLFDPLHATEPARTKSPEASQPEASHNRAEHAISELPREYASQTGLQVERVVIFYSDHSFDSYTPKQNR